MSRFMFLPFKKSSTLALLGAVAALTLIAMTRSGRGGEAQFNAQVATPDGVTDEKATTFVQSDTIGLRGIRQVGLMVFVDDLAAKDFPQDQLLEPISKSLADLGITVVGPEGWKKQTDVPTVMVMIEAHPAGNGHALYGVEFRVWDRLEVKRTPGVLMIATTYERKRNGVAPMENLVDEIASSFRQMFELFVEDFKAENPAN